MGMIFNTTPDRGDHEIREDSEGNRYFQIDDMKFMVELKNPPPPLVADKGPFALVEGNVWPGRAVPITMTALSSSQKRAIKSACQLWSAAAGVKFTENHTESDHAYFQPSTGNDSFVGYIRGLGRHPVNIQSWHDIPRIAHEIGHVLGLGHEHQRSDASNYIVVNTANLTAAGRRMFAPVSGTLATDYDLLSISHYDEYIPDANFVIDPQKPAFTLRPGYEAFSGKVGIKRISQSDAAVIRRLYFAHAIA